MFVWMYGDVVSSATLAIPSNVGLFFFGGIFVDVCGIDAAFWHISWIAGLLLLLSALVVTVVYSNHTAPIRDADKNPLSRRE